MNLFRSYFLFIYFLTPKYASVSSSSVNDIAYKTVLTEATNLVLKDFIRISEAEDLEDPLSYSILDEAFNANKVFLSNCGYKFKDTLPLMIFDYFVKKCVRYNIGSTDDSLIDLNRGQDAKSVIILLYEFHIHDIEIPSRYLNIIIEFLFRFGGQSTFLNTIFFDLSRVITSTQAEDLLKMISKKFDPKSHSLFNMSCVFMISSSNSNSDSNPTATTTSSSSSEAIESLYQKLMESELSFSDRSLFREHLTNIFTFILISKHMNRFENIISEALESIDFNFLLKKSSYINTLSVAVVADSQSSLFGNLPSLLIKDEIFSNLASEKETVFGRLLDSLQSSYPDSVCECKSTLSEENQNKFTAILADYSEYQSIHFYAINTSSIATVFESNDPKELTEFINGLECTNQNFDLISEHDFSLSIDILNVITDFIDNLSDHNGHITTNLGMIKFRLIVSAFNIAITNAVLSTNSHVGIMTILKFYIDNIASSENRKSSSVSISFNLILEQIKALIEAKYFNVKKYHFSLIYEFLSMTSNSPDSDFSDIISRHLRCNGTFDITKNLIVLTQENGSFEPNIFLAYFLYEFAEYIKISEAEKVDLNCYKNGLIVKLAHYYHDIHIFDKTASFASMEILKQY